MDPLWSEIRWSTFKYFIILIGSTYYILVHQLDNKVFQCHWCTVQTWRTPHTVYMPTLRHTRAGKAQSVSRLPTGWTIRGSNLGWGEVLHTRPDQPWGPPSLLWNGYRVLPWGKAAGAWRWPPHLVPRKSTAIPLLFFWVFVTCSRVRSLPLPLPNATHLLFRTSVVRKGLEVTCREESAVTWHVTQNTISTHRDKDTSHVVTLPKP